MPEATRSPAEWWLELIHASRRLHEMHFDDIPDLPAELIPDSIECEELGHQIDNLLDWLDDHGYEPPDLHEGILATAAQALTQPAPPAQQSVQTLHLHRRGTR